MLGQLIIGSYTESVSGWAELATWDSVAQEWRSRYGDHMRQEHEEVLGAAGGNA